MAAMIDSHESWGRTDCRIPTADLGMGLHVNEPIALDFNAYAEYFGRRGDLVEIKPARASSSSPWLRYGFPNLVWEYRDRTSRAEGEEKSRLASIIWLWDIPD